MARKKSPDNLSPQKRKAIWKQISPADWLTLLQEHRPSNKWERSGNKIKGCCIWHAENTPSLVIDLDKGLAHCFGQCTKQTEWDPIRFIAAAAKSNYASALGLVKNRFGIRFSASFMQNIQKIEDNNRMKQFVFEAMNRELDDGLRNPSAPEFAYMEESGLFHWLQQRGFPVGNSGAVHRWPVGVMLPQDRLVQRLEDMGQQEVFNAAYQYFQQYLPAPGAKSPYTGALVYVFCTSPTTIGRFRVRVPNTKNFYAIDDPYDDTAGFFGLNTFTHLLGDLSQYPLFVVEGEMDALSLIAHDVVVGNDDCVVATGGNMSVRDEQIDELAEYGFKEIILVPDSDSKGRTWAMRLLSRNEKVDRVFLWSDNDLKLKIKDVDEAIRAHGYEEVRNRLNDTASIPRNHEWALEHLDRELAGIDSENVDAIHEKASEYGLALKRAPEQDAFVKAACEAHGLSREVVLQDMIPDDDTEESFVRRLARKLREAYHFLTMRQVGGSLVVSAWSNTKQVMRVFPMAGHNNVKAILVADLGHLGDYIKNELGEPDFLKYTFSFKGEPIALTSDKKNKKILSLFLDAMDRALDEAKESERLTELAQGLHFIKRYDETGEPAVFIINGSKYFQGTIKDDEITYKQLTKPVHGNYFFRLANQPWSSNLLTMKDIEAAKDIDPRQVYEQILEMLNLGWRFVNHDLEAKFVAADVMYTPIAAVFQRMILTDITGDTHSGKSTLMQIIGGEEYPDIRLCEASLVLDDFSAAAIRQKMNRSRLRLILDEFEDDGTSYRPGKRAIAVRDVLDIFRSIATGATTVRGTSTGDFLEYHLYFPVTVGGIWTMREARDVNRYVHIKLRRVEGFKDPIEPIRKRYPYEELKRLRRGVTLGLLHKIPELMDAHRSMKREFADNVNLPPGLQTRLKDNLLPAASILKLVGEDYVSFLKKFCSLKMEEFEEQGAGQESTSVWEHILHTPIELSRHTPDLYGTAPIAKMITDTHMNGLLNGTDLGVYFVPGKKWLVVFWRKAIPGVLHNSPVYGRYQFPGRLKMVADADPRIVPKTKLTKRFLREEVVPRVGTRVSLNDISVLDLNNTLADVKQKEDAQQGEAERKRMLEDIPEEVPIKGGEFET
jgi:DNA primase